MHYSTVKVYHVMKFGEKLTSDNSFIAKLLYYIVSEMSTAFIKNTQI